MGSFLHYGRIFLFADAIFIAGLGLFIILLPRRSTDGKRIGSPLVPVLGAIVFAEFAMLLIYLGISLVLGNLDAQTRR